MRSEFARLDEVAHPFQIITMVTIREQVFLSIQFYERLFVGVSNSAENLNIVNDANEATASYSKRFFD